MIDYERARETMVDNQLRTSGVNDRRILAAMGEMPRELFVPELRRSLAYTDTSHALGGPSGRALAAPAPFAKLVQLAAIEADDAVLDVGTGTGYSAAVLGRLAATVVAVESDPELAAAARAALGAVGAANVSVHEGALEAGAPKFGPYDVVLIEGAVNAVSAKLLQQLKQGGRLVALIRKGAAAAAHVFVRSGDEFAPRAEFNTSLPPLTAERPAERFVF
jgi:protein-L-isoaspartate(D-aspartate) O-methyltransferase